MEYRSVRVSVISAVFGGVADCFSIDAHYCFDRSAAADLQFGDLVEVVLKETLGLSIRWSAFATSARRLVHVRSLGLRPETTT